VTCSRVTFTFTFVFYSFPPALFLYILHTIPLSVILRSVLEPQRQCIYNEVGLTFLEEKLLRWFQAKTRGILLTSRKWNVTCHGWRQRALLCASDIRMRYLSAAPIFNSDLKISAWMLQSYCAWNVRKNVQILQHVPVRCNVTSTRDFDNRNVTVVTAGVSLWRSAVRVAFVEPFSCKLFFSILTPFFCKCRSIIYGSRDGSARRVTAWVSE
jgi:hypothetical protein